MQHNNKELFGIDQNSRNLSVNLDLKYRFYYLLYNERLNFDCQQQDIPFEASLDQKKAWV